jgi:hypothetical protein
MTKDHKLPRFTPTIPTAGVAHGTRATLTAKKSNMAGISMETHDSSVTPEMRDFKALKIAAYSL